MVGWSATLFCVKHQSQSFHNMAARIQLLRYHEKLGSCLSSSVHQTSPFLYLVDAQRFCNAKWCKISVFWTLLTHQIPLLASFCPQHYRCHLSFGFTSKTPHHHLQLLCLHWFFSSPLFSFLRLLSAVAGPHFFFIILSSFVGPHFVFPSLMLSSVSAHFFRPSLVFILCWSPLLSSFSYLVFRWSPLFLPLRSIIIISLLLYFFLHCFSSVLFLNLWQIGWGWTSTPFEWWGLLVAQKC